MKNHQKRAMAGVTLAVSAALIAGAVAPSASAESSDSITRAASNVDAAATAYGSAGTADAAGAAATVEVPATSAGSVTVRSPGTPSIGFSLPETKRVEGVTTASGTVFYPGAAPSADIAVQHTDGGARALVNIKDASAPHEYRYGLALPQGASVTSEEDGGVLIKGADGAVIGAVDAPWARDAAGKPVATQYRIEGTTLIQNVAFSENSAFPVVADPNLSGAAKALIGKIKKIPGWSKAAHGKYKDFDKWMGKQNWAVKTAWWAVKGQAGYMIFEYLNKL
ncbi:hypothetical protein ABZ769_27095 [Streptomyces olivoreticuli]